MALFGDLLAGDGSSWFFDLENPPGGGFASGSGVTVNASQADGSAAGEAAAVGDVGETSTEAPNATAIDAVAAQGSGVTVSVEIPTAQVEVLLSVVLEAPLYTGPGSVLFPNNFEGTPEPGHIIWYPVEDGFTVLPNGEVIADDHSGDYQCYYDDGESLYPFAITLTSAIVASGAGVDATAPALLGGLAFETSSGDIPSVDAIAPEGAATGEASAQGQIAAVGAVAPDATAWGASIASGSLPQASVVAPSATAVGTVIASGAGVLNFVDAPHGQGEGASIASGEGVSVSTEDPLGQAQPTGPSNAFGVIDVRTVSAPSGTAAGGLNISASLSVAASVAVSGGASGAAIATGAIPSVSALGVQGAAGGEGRSVSTVGTVTTQSPAASATGASTAVGEIVTVPASQPLGAAVGGVHASGAVAAVDTAAPSGSVTGAANVAGSVSVASSGAPLAFARGGALCEGAIADASSIPSTAVAGGNARAIGEPINAVHAGVVSGTATGGAEAPAELPFGVSSSPSGEALSTESQVGSIDTVRTVAPSAIVNGGAVAFGAIAKVRSAIPVGAAIGDVLPKFEPGEEPKVEAPELRISSSHRRPAIPSEGGDVSSISSAHRPKL